MLENSCPCSNFLMVIAITSLIITLNVSGEDIFIFNYHPHDTGELFSHGNPHLSYPFPRDVAIKTIYISALTFCLLLPWGICCSCQETPGKVRESGREMTAPPNFIIILGG
jgi:hypothetical protein